MIGSHKSHISSVLSHEHEFVLSNYVDIRCLVCSVVALAHQFVRAGSKLILAARSIDKLERIKQQLIEAHRVGSTLDRVCELKIGLIFIQYRYG